MYLINNTTQEVAIFGNPQSGWIAASQEQVDAYLLVRAKRTKLAELDGSRNIFCAAGFLYLGDTFIVDTSAIVNIGLKDSLLGYESNNVSAMAATSAYILPAGHGIKVNPGQAISVSGFTEAENNGAKTVYQLQGDYLVVDEILVDEAVGDDICIYDANRYKFYDIEDVLVEFADKTAWDVFFSALMGEKDRIMIYYCSTKKLIKDCADVAAVDAIVIDFAA